MTEIARASTVIEADPQRCLEVALDYERYPEWADDIHATTIDRRDDEGRGAEVTYEVSAFGRGTNYTLIYDYGGLPGELRWSLLEGQIMKRCDGVYEFVPVTNRPGHTEVIYELEIDLAVPLPGFVKRRAESRIVRTAMANLKRRVESGV